MSQTIKWGILSTAGIARSEFIPAIKRAKNAELIAISSLSGQASEVAERFEIKHSYDNYEQLLDNSEIDAIYIPLPNHLHKEWAIKAAQKKKHILCEKPAALSAAEVIEIKEACEENDVQFMEGFMYAFHPQHQRVRELIKSNAIGEVKQFNGSFSFFLGDGEGNIRTAKNKGGGSLYDIGCYPIHAMRHVLEEEPQSVRTEAIIHPKYDVETSAISHFKFESGIVGVTESSFDMVFRAEYELIGTTGRITVPHAFRPDTSGGEGVIIIQNGDGVNEERLSGELYLAEIEHFSDAIINKTKPLISLEDSYLNMRTLDACFESIAIDKRVDI